MARLKATYLLSVYLPGAVFGEGLIDFEVDEKHHNYRDEEGAGRRVDRVTGQIEKCTLKCVVFMCKNMSKIWGKTFYYIK
jgi:hypothetical protein